MNCIVQYFMIPSGFSQPEFNNLGHSDELFEYSKKSIKRYAEKIGADYHLVTQPKINHRHPTFERFDLFKDLSWYDTYNHILYLDTDVICWPDAPNIFEMYPSTEHFKPVEDNLARKRSIQHHHNTSIGSCLNKYDPQILKQRRFNAGVFMLNKSCAEKMSLYIDLDDPSDDNQMLIDIMLKSRIPTQYMDARFNKKMGTKSWFGHAYGQDKMIPDNKVITKCRAVFR